MTHIEHLKIAVEKTLGHACQTPRDFDLLSLRLLDITGRKLSPTTLKRLWGYLPAEQETKPSRQTLNILASYAGYTDYAQFEKTAMGINQKVESGFTHQQELKACSLPRGKRIRVKWHPDRCIVIRHEGQELFYVEEAHNTKLAVGDNFLCFLFINGEPLQLTRVVHKGGQPCNFICGKLKGISFDIL
jgi:hypothetical protein